LHCSYETDHNGLEDNVLKRLRTDLGLVNTEDLYIVLAQADKFRNDIFAEVIGDPQIKGAKVLELFDNF
jgi:hypothetical protein